MKYEETKKYNDIRDIQRNTKEYQRIHKKFKETGANQTAHIYTDQPAAPELNREQEFQTILYPTAIRGNTREYMEICRNTNKYEEMHGNTRKFEEIRRIHGNTKKY